MARSRPVPREAMAYAKIVARAWSDPAFKQQLMADPRAVMAAEGIPVAQGVTMRVVENTENLVHLVLPVKPADHELSVEALQSRTGYSYCRGEPALATAGSASIFRAIRRVACARTIKRPHMVAVVGKSGVSCRSQYRKWHPPKIATAEPNASEKVR